MANATRTRDRATVSGLAVWRLGEGSADAAAAATVDDAVRAVQPHVTGWAVVCWPLGRSAPRVTATGPVDGDLDPSCWHLLFGGMLIAPLLDIRAGAPFRERPTRRREMGVFVNRVRDLVVPGSCVLATLGPAAQVFPAADAVHDVLGPRAALAGATLTLDDHETAVVADVFLETAPAAVAAAG